jgi:RND family efflux transporter MFP subunit
MKRKNLFCYALLLLWVADTPVRAWAASGANQQAASSVGVLPGDPSAWWIGIPLLLAVLLIGFLAWRRRRSRGTLWMVAAAATLVLVVTFVRARYAPGAMDMSSMQAVSGGAPTPVTIAVLGTTSGRASIDVPATLAPFLQQDLVARVPGLVTGLSVYAGDRVRAGQVVAFLNEPELQSDAAAAAADESAAVQNAAYARSAAAAATDDVSAKRAQARYWASEIAREHFLYSQGAVSAQEYQDELAQATGARNAYAAARANAAGAGAQAAAAAAQIAAAQSMAGGKASLAGYASVIVPNDAIVMKRLVDPGVAVTAGTAILEIAVIDRLRVQAQVAQADLASIDIGTPLDVDFDDGQTAHARVTSISPVLDADTRTAIVEAVVANPGDRYQPGGFARVVLHPRQMRKDAFSVPSAALIGGASPSLWIDRDEAAHRIPVTVLSDDGVNASVRGALRSGMRVIVAGAANLEEGDAVDDQGGP